MEVETKSRGRIHANIEEGSGFDACIVVGVADWGSEAMAALREAGGVFHIDHQTAGLSCNHRSLAGAVLPLSRCKSAVIVEALGAIRDVFHGDHDEAVWRPTLTQVREIADLLGKAGLGCERTFRSIEEAYVPFDLTEGAYVLLRREFEMITLLREDGWRGEILETAPLRWATARELVDDMTNAPAFGGHAVFLFENSD